MKFSSYSEAFDQMPQDAKLSCTFGSPGKGGYVEFWRLDGIRYKISNGSYAENAPFTWTIEKEAL